MDPTCFCYPPLLQVLSQKLRHKYNLKKTNLQAVWPPDRYLLCSLAVPTLQNIYNIVQFRYSQQSFTTTTNTLYLRLRISISVAKQGYGKAAPIAFITALTTSTCRSPQSTIVPTRNHGKFTFLWNTRSKVSIFVILYWAIR